jgi:hypothetical protein
MMDENEKCDICGSPIPFTDEDIKSEGIWHDHTERTWHGFGIFKIDLDCTDGRELLDDEYTGEVICPACHDKLFGKDLPVASREITSILPAPVPVPSLPARDVPIEYLKFNMPPLNEIDAWTRHERKMRELDAGKVPPSDGNAPVKRPAGKKIIAGR